MERCSPTTAFLADLRKRLEPLKMAIYFKLPDPSVLEPFIVIGSTMANTHLTAQSGQVIEDTTQQIDIFMPGDERLEAEEVRMKAIRYLGRSSRITSEMLVDDSVGREVFHIVIQLTKRVF